MNPTLLTLTLLAGPAHAHAACPIPQVIEAKLRGQLAVAGDRLVAVRHLSRLPDGSHQVHFQFEYLVADAWVPSLGVKAYKIDERFCIATAHDPR